MIVLGLILGIFALVLLCRLLFTLAVFALPCFAGVTAGIWSYHHAAGLAGAMLVALLTGMATFALGQVAFAHLRAPLARASIALLFAVPAAIAGYHAALGIAEISGASANWCEAFAVLGAAMVGGTALARLAAWTRLDHTMTAPISSDRFASQG